MKGTFRCVLMFACTVILTALFSCTSSQSLPPEPPEQPAHEHGFGEWSVVSEASCTTEGLRERVCACGERQSEVIAMTAHQAGEWHVEASPTCTTSGKQYRECGLS